MEQKSKSASPSFSVRDFFKRFPDDEACLEHIFNVRFGERHVCRACGVESTFHRMSDRRAWACAHCGDHLYPTAGTIFQDTRTPLQVWFYAIYLFVTTRHGISGKELQRQLGVTYKTAWRMGHKIREQMEKSDFSGFLSGEIEADEAYIGGRQKGSRGRSTKGKTVIAGVKQRGGPIKARVVPDASKASLRPLILDNVERGSHVSTDEWRAYELLVKDGYRHGTVNHSKDEWARYDQLEGVNVSTNSVENFWRHFKHSMRSTHISESQKHMPKYLGEFTFRANHRDEVNQMFDRLIARF
ncbi:MAG: IS1595 family transposase [Maritimibacter sp.]|nr:IS1595 family transposase [Maritimibacter sp.]